MKALVGFLFQLPFFIAAGQAFNDAHVDMLTVFVLVASVCYGRILQEQAIRENAKNEPKSD